MDYITTGISQGFRIGFNYSQPLKSCSHNLLSAAQFPVVVDEYLASKSKLSRIVQIPEHLQSKVHLNPFGVISKKHKPGKWRLIVDLSAPDGFSVNDGISKEQCSLKLTYTSVDDVIKCILQLGQGALLAKLDIKQAYRNVPVHPDDRLLLGMRWKEITYIDKTLPFGLRSAPIIFSAVVDALQWTMQQKGIQFLFHYLDDFITIGRPRSPECAQNLHIMEQCCSLTGTPLEREKIEGPATCLPILGIELDTMLMQIRLPDVKLQNLRKLTGEWKGRKAGKKRELMSLIGSLNHACKAIHQGRSFLRRLINLGLGVKCHTFKQIGLTIMQPQCSTMNVYILQVHPTHCGS